jgi:hypothetical protein
MMIVRRMVGFLIVLSYVAAAACAPSRPAAALRPPPPPRVMDPPRGPKNAAVPSCNFNGCCQGHGDVAFVQPDKAIMCTDGTPSEICDCH